MRISDTGQRTWIIFLVAEEICCTRDAISHDGQCFSRYSIRANAAIAFVHVPGDELAVRNVPERNTWFKRTILDDSLEGAELFCSVGVQGDVSIRAHARLKTGATIAKPGFSLGHDHLGK